MIQGIWGQCRFRHWKETLGPCEHRGFEYTPKNYSRSIVKKNGIKWKLSQEKTPKQNGTTKRMNTTMVERYEIICFKAWPLAFCGQRKLTLPTTLLTKDQLRPIWELHPKRNTPKKNPMSTTQECRATKHTCTYWKPKRTRWKARPSSALLWVMMTSQKLTCFSRQRKKQSYWPGRNVWYEEIWLATIQSTSYRR